MKAKKPIRFRSRNTYYTTKKHFVNELTERLIKIGGNAKQRIFDKPQFVQIAHFFSEGLLHIAERKRFQLRKMCFFPVFPCKSVTFIL